MFYTGEHLLPGKLGHFFVLLSLVASLVATIAYFKATNAKNPVDANGWKRFARYAFFTEVFSVFAVFGILYYIISNHYFEYRYAWQHSSRDLDTKYLLSCFWEGQEGSFMLWSVWHCVLGSILIWKEKTWEAPVMSVISFVQFCLATMIIGLYFFGHRVGSNPFELLRLSEFGTGPVFSRPDYLTLIKDGNGLNPLLQNYWMVIHPPVLFLGFASTVVPFAYAIGGLWTKKFGDWVKPALPWALFSGGILGLGIMMGGAWAYESLTFGGYWAWDPVENASMVPWLTLIGGIHMLLVYKATGHSLRSAFLFFILTFLLILYSTFLTRSGILGDTSVHAFTDLGMNVQLLLFLMVFVLPAFALLFIRYKQVPYVIKEENSDSREFWMFIGSLVFLLSALYIIGATSIPVFNKLTGQKIALGEDVEFFYNRVLIFIAVIIGLLTAITQYLKYKDTGKGWFGKKILLPTIIALVVATLVSIIIKIKYDKHGAGFQGALYLALFTSIYAVVANTTYIWTGLKGKLKNAGGSVSHIGFGLMLTGILISSANKEVVSINTTGISPFRGDNKESPRENLTLIKNVPTDMGKYTVTYLGDSTMVKDPKQYYRLFFQRKDGKESFHLYPDAFVNFKGQEGLMANPDSRHYLHKDIFTYITSLPDPKQRKQDTATFRPNKIDIGDTIYYSNGFVILNSIGFNPTDTKHKFTASDTALVANFTVVTKEGAKTTLNPYLLISGNRYQPVTDTLIVQSLILQLEKIDFDPTTKKISKVDVGLKETGAIMDYITLKAYEFPFINILWLGIVVMVVGLGMSSVNRIKQNRRSARSLSAKL
jgi:cytochrome c-type biogenesis protein CcmF